MQRIDLIIDALENAVHNFAGDDTDEKCIAALAAARELRALEPVLWKATDAWFYKKPLCEATPLYALDNEAQIVQPDVTLTNEGKTEQEPAPPRKEWVGLTDDQRDEMIGRIQHDQYTRQRDLIRSTQIITEMYLKEENGG